MKLSLWCLRPFTTQYIPGPVVVGLYPARIDIGGTGVWKEPAVGCDRVPGLEVIARKTGAIRRYTTVLFDDPQRRTVRAGGQGGHERVVAVLAEEDEVFRRGSSTAVWKVERREVDDGAGLERHDFSARFTATNS